MCKLRVWWLYYIGTSHTLRPPYYENFCTTKVTILRLYIVQNVQVTSMVTVLYRHTHCDHHTMKIFVLPRSPYCYVQNVQVTSMVTVLYRHKSHIATYENFCTKVTILRLYIVQNVQVTSMVTVLYRHKSHIATTILWKFLYYQGHHTATLHSTKCASYEYGDCTI